MRNGKIQKNKEIQKNICVLRNIWKLSIVMILIMLIIHPHTISAEPYREEKAWDVKDIFILHSYSPDFVWTRDENEGILDRLTRSGSYYNIMTEYMDWKGYPKIENLRYLYEYYQYKYRDKNIDIIIATDDVALSFALMYRKELFSDAPIVFCGVNEKDAGDMIENQSRVYGVTNVIDPSGIMSLAHHLHPNLETVYLVYDNTPSGVSIGETIENKIKENYPKLNIRSANKLTFTELLDEASKLEKESIILLTTYYSDYLGEVRDIGYVAKRISEYSSVPVYHFYDFALGKNMENGGIGGELISGRLQGELTADLAVSILQGEKIENFIVEDTKIKRRVLNYDQLVRFGIPLKNVPEGYEIINRPFSFYENYKGLVHFVLTIFAVLLIFLGIVVHYLRKINRMKKDLAKNNVILSGLYAELAVSNEEVQKQYEEMMVINRRIQEGEEKLTYLAYYDSLTGLPNKYTLFEDAGKIFNTESGKSALFFMDIDYFKYVNDTLGHATGDQLIIKVAKRLEQIKTEHMTVYRLSGDEFVLVMNHIDSREEAEEFARKILDSFADDTLDLNYVLQLSLSIGIVIYPEHGKDLEELLRYADLAMYRVKENGKKNYMVYHPEMGQTFSERVVIEKHLRNALKNNEFEVHYQPQLDLQTMKMRGFEALLRWKSNALGNVPPLRFIPIAEETHEIIPIGTWVLEKSCEFLHDLNEAGYDDLTVSVNISMFQLVKEDFCDIVERIIHKYNIKPYHLELEITETILMESFETIIPRLKQLNQIQVKIALDDFGKGYSSLNYLKQLPINTLKIDKIFIDSVLDQNQDVLTGQIIVIGKRMGLEVIAEGVETRKQMEYLKESGCDIMQGYLYSKPVCGSDMIRMLEENGVPFDKD